MGESSVGRRPKPIIAAAATAGIAACGAPLRAADAPVTGVTATLSYRF